MQHRDRAVAQQTHTKSYTENDRTFCVIPIPLHTNRQQHTRTVSIKECSHSSPCTWNFILSRVVDQFVLDACEPIKKKKKIKETAEWVVCSARTAHPTKTAINQRPVQMLLAATIPQCHTIDHTKSNERILLSLIVFPSYMFDFHHSQSIRHAHTFCQVCNITFAPCCWRCCCRYCYCCYC